VKQSVKTILVWLVLIGLFAIIMKEHFDRPSPTDIEFSAFILKALPEPTEPGGPKPPSGVSKVTVKGDRLEGEFVDGQAYRTVGDLKDFQKEMIARGIAVRYESEDAGIWVTILTTWLPMLFFVFLFMMFMRQAQSGGGKLFSFGKSKHRTLTEDSRKVTFADIAGIEEAKAELHEIIEFLKDPKKFTRLGGRIPKGVLLMGSPGTGKTLLARGVAGEAGVPFLSISGSDFVEMFVGVGASRVRDLFEQGKKRAPCIIFIDEIDAVGRQRGAGLGGGHDEREQTLNQLLVEMDGFEANTGVIIVAATNRPDVLDPALLRPGRFDRRIVVPSPDVKGREEILKVHTRNVPLAEDVKLELLARGTPGFVGADLENIVNEAALAAARKDQNDVHMADFEEAKDKVLMGTARRSIVMNDHERELTAYHEAGHAIIARSVPGADPLHKVTIIPRGLSLGMTQQLPSEDRYTASKTYLLNQLAILMGGRAAEMLAFGEVSSGAGQDIKMATEQARRMVAQFGMSNLGPIHMSQSSELVFLGKDLTSHNEISEATSQRVDREIKRIILESQDKAMRILTERADALKALAVALLDIETLDGAAVDVVMAEHPATEIPAE
jgi:cell division protease FtsH